MERRIKSLVRWNALAMVVRANKIQEGIGGHISTFASAATTDAPAPSMTDVVRAGGGAALPSLMGSQSKAPTPALQVTHVSQGISRGLLVKQIPPAYPATALQRGTEGVVELLATISKDGNISAVKTLSGDAQLSHAAVEAVKQWKYKPYRCV